MKKMFADESEYQIADVTEKNLSYEEKQAVIREIAAAVVDFDLDKIDELIKSFEGVELKPQEQLAIKKIKEAIFNFDYDGITAALTELV